MNVSSPSWLAPETPDLVWFRGTDTVRFLNDLLTQEIATLEPGKVRRSLLLAPRGKMDHLLWVLRGHDEVGLITDPGRGAELAATLGRYRIRVDVDIDESQAPAWLVMGEWTVGPGTWQHSNGGIVADISWSGAKRSLVVGSLPDLESGTLEEYESVRIAAGEPRWGVDVDEKTIPQESGLANVTIDFSKGCFLGQELVGRIDSRGHVNRRLRLLELATGSAEPGAAIESADKEVGVLSSVSGTSGMALIRREVEPGDRVVIGGESAVVRSVPTNPRT